MMWLYAGFVLFILVMLFLDLKVVNRDAHVIKPRESLLFTGFTVLLALAFAGAVFVMYERNWPVGITETVVRQATTLAEANPDANPAVVAAAKAPTGHGFEATVVYLTAWVLEYSLSVDNIFVIAVIFTFFRVPPQYQHRVLFWGILGALIMRGAMIAAGAALVAQFQWIDYVFGGFLVYTAYKMARSGEGHSDVGESLPVRMARRLIPITSDFEGERFFVRRPLAAKPTASPGPHDRPTGPAGLDPSAAGTGIAQAAAGAAGKLRLHATPLFLALMVVEFTDVIFAVDSIPAVFGVTEDPFLVFTSNVFAILGLRSLFFALSAALGSFRYLKVSLVFVLAFVGFKMLLHSVLHIPHYVSLALILLMLLGGVVASLFASAHERRIKRAPLADLAGAFEVTRRNLKKIFVFIIGATVVLLGIAVSWIPGPGGAPIVIAGLMILATEFIWAQYLLKRLKTQASQMAQGADWVAQKSSPWVIAPVLMIAAAVVIAAAHYGGEILGVSSWTIALFSLVLWFPLLYWAVRVVVLYRRGTTGSPAEGAAGRPAVAPPPTRDAATP